MYRALLDVIDAACKGPVSVADYFDVVQCIRDVASKRNPDDVMLSTDEQHEGLSRGYNPRYNPFDSPEKIRFGLCFVVGVDNQEVASYIAVLRSKL